MKIGTKSVLLGAHQFLIHPWFVAWGWWKLYGFPFDLRLWAAFFVHDIGYIGKPNMDGEEGELHPYMGAKLMRFLFGQDWYEFTLYHSRHLAKLHGKSYSKLCVADKLAIALTPTWLYLPMVNLTGEVKEYLKGRGNRTRVVGTQYDWHKALQKYCASWAYEYKDIKKDTWTGTQKDVNLEVA